MPRSTCASQNSRQTCVDKQGCEWLPAALQRKRHTSWPNLLERDSQPLGRCVTAMSPDSHWTTHLAHSWKGLLSSNRQFPWVQGAPRDTDNERSAIWDVSLQKWRLPTVSDQREREAHQHANGLGRDLQRALKSTPLGK
jgi:hypothetical protein